MNSPFALSLVVAVFVGGAAAFLGSLMVSKRMALTGDALGHVALPGMGLALLFHWDVSTGAFASLLIGLFFVWKWGRSTQLSMETLVGVVFVASLAVGFLIVPQPELLESLIGDISKVSSHAALFSVTLSVLTVMGVRRIYPGMILLNVSEDLATVEGISPTRYNLIYLLAIALIVSLGVRVTGSLLVGALVIIPPAIVREISSNLAQYAYGSLLVGAATSAIGILSYRLTGFPAGPSIILVNVLLFAAVRMKRSHA